MALIAGIVAAFALDLHEQIDGAELRGALRDEGVRGAALFVLVFALVQPLGVAVHIFLVTASLVWSAPLAIGLSWLGALGAGILAFSFARFVAFDWAQARIPARLSRYDRVLETRGFRTVVVLRLIFFTTPLVQLMLGVSRVRFRDYVLASCIGVVPWTVFFVLLGTEISSWLADHPVASWNWAYLGWTLGAVAALIFLYVLARRRMQVPGAVDRDG